MVICKRMFFALAVLSISGCTVVTLSVAGASLGITYTMTNIAHKTFNFPINDVDEATFAGLRKLEFDIVSYKDLGEKRKIEALAKDRDIRIKLEKITATTTQMSVDARTWPFFKDRATAVEIIYQVYKILDPNAIIKASLD